MAAAAPLAISAGKAVTGAITGDIVKLHGRFFRRVVLQEKKRKSKKFPAGREEISVLEPIEVDVHLNPVSIGLGVAAGAVALLGGWIAWKGIRFGTPLGEFQVFPGIEGTALGDRIKELPLPLPGTPPEELPPPSTVPDCSGLRDGFFALKGWDAFFLDITGIRRGAARLQWDEAASRGCDWVRSEPRP